MLEVGNDELRQRAADFLAGFRCGQTAGDAGGAHHYFTGYIFDGWNPNDPSSVPPSRELVEEVQKAMLSAYQEALRK